MLKALELQLQPPFTRLPPIITAATVDTNGISQLVWLNNIRGK